MHATGVIVSVLAGLAAAAPSTQPRAEAKSMMAAAQTWTITGLKRVCNAADTSCTWTFGINNGSGTTACKEVVTGSPASQTNGGPATCGVRAPCEDLTSGLWTHVC